jgi:branched-chain amino acid transport system permease protein
MRASSLEGHLAKSNCLVRAPCRIAAREGRPITEVLQLLLAGTAQGCVYALVALGFVLIYKATETVNFAQGDLMMLGAFFALTGATVLGLPYWLTIVFAVAVMAVVGMLAERLILRPVLGHPAFTVVMITIGLGYVMRGVVTMVPGWGTETYQIPTPFADDVLRAGGVVLPVQQLMVIAMTAGLCAALYLFFRRSRLGIAMQATSQNQLAAYYMGIPVRRVNMMIWGLSAGVAAFAGILLAPVTFVHSNMGFIGLKAFPAAVVGGFGSVPGAIVGGLIIGVVESLAGFYLPEGFKDVAAYVVVLVVLLVRPSGIFGETARKKV